MSQVERSGIFSKRTVKNRGPLLQIFRGDQASLPEEKQRPHIVVEFDGKSSQCMWVSREPVDEAKAKVARTIGRHRGSLAWEQLGGGVSVVIDNAWIAYEGNHEGPWVPRFTCTIEEGSLPVKPLAQLVASTVFERQFPQRVIEGLITDFISNPQVLLPQ